VRRGQQSQLGPILKWGAEDSKQEEAGSVTQMAKLYSIVNTPETQHIKPGWFAVHTRYQHERTVAMGLNQKQIETFLPMYDSVHRWRDRNKRISLPLFPGYIFVAGAIENRLGILNTPGVCAILSIAGMPAEIPTDEIEAIRRIAKHPERIEPYPYLAEGDRIRVKSGPFVDIEGTLVRKRDSSHIIISVDMLGRSASVQIDGAMVERLYSPIGPVHPSISQNRSSHPV
jgi:transcription termination/antitermination protein NusG